MCWVPEERRDTGKSNGAKGSPFGNVLQVDLGVYTFAPAKSWSGHLGAHTQKCLL
jgi:hypothetical protein